MGILESTLTLKVGCKQTIDLLNENPVLQVGAVMYEVSPTGHIIGCKIGDGKHQWTELVYLQGGISELEYYTQEEDLKEYQLRKQYEPIYPDEIVYNGGNCSNGL